MENIKNWAGWTTNPVRVRVTGTAEYVFNILCNLVQHNEDMEYDHEQDIRNDSEGDERYIYE